MTDVTNYTYERPIVAVWVGNETILFLRFDHSTKKFDVMMVDQHDTCTRTGCVFKKRADAMASAKRLAKTWKLGRVQLIGREP